ncbi:expressed unknown protein [Seminavis robusta]|uniref:Uncharacterized protein n=1 Tax=Seminavis robusta TaxID=568900 RepID=A0A9N8E8Q6_9STRA|nr:expressed unknown protein [Seminavis robusta]|eukprot:Sro808_g205400.1 n/a (670) ;mRNA; f:18242-20251
MESSRMTGSSSYDAKVEHLLTIADHHDHDNFQSERYLVALVLLTNHQLMNVQQFQTVWNHHRTLLECFCRRLLLLLPNTSTKSNVTNARFVALLLERLLGCLEGKDSINNENLEESSTRLLHLLLDFVRQSQKTQSFLPLITQIVEVLNGYCTRFPSHNKPSLLLLETNIDLIWECYTKGMAAEQLLVSSVEEKQETAETTAKSDQTLMEETLTAILDRTDSTSNTTAQWQERLHQSVQELVRNHVLVVMTQESPQSIASLWRWFRQCLMSSNPLLDLKQKGKDPSHQRSWHETLLLFVNSLATHPELVAMLQESSSKAALVKLLLANITMPTAGASDTTNNHRMLAWTALASLVAAKGGCDWLLMDTDATTKDTKNDTKALGNAAHLCALIRLTSGEWRILLGYALEQQSSTNDSVVIQACAQILASLLAYMSQLAQDLEEGNTSRHQQLLPAALLHLRDSLEDALQATCLFLGQASGKKEVDDDIPVMIQLLGLLLSEFDAFEGLKHVDTAEILKALDVVVQNSLQAQEQQHYVMASLLGIMETACDDSYRVLLLKKHNLLGENMAWFLCHYWSTNSSASSVPVACRLTEIWHVLLTEHQSELRLVVNTEAIEKAIVAWIKKGAHQEPAAIINDVIGCFVTLRGDNPPSNEDALILQQAMEYCAAHS